MVNFIIIVITYQESVVRCPGHAIHFMRFGYEEYVRRVLKLVGVNFESVVKGVKKHESWNPWNPDRLQGIKKD